jgi:hypothetical protein
MILHVRKESMTKPMGYSNYRFNRVLIQKPETIKN